MKCNKLRRDETDLEKIERLAEKVARKEGWRRVYVTRCDAGNYDFTPDKPGAGIRVVEVLFPPL